MKQAILMTSFGTTYEETRQKNIVSLETFIAQSFPDYQICTAYTSNMVRKRLAQKGIEVDDVPAALDKLSAQGVQKVIIQPTHLLYGDEFDKLCAQALDKEYAFHTMLFSTPLLSDTQAMKDVLKIISQSIVLQEDECLVLMGHGTEHFCNPVYGALDYMAKAEGYPAMFVGTVEAYPDVQTVLNQVKKSGYKKVVLAPLMLVAGDHAVNDLASDEEDSWKSIFETAGYPVRCVLKGLGEYPSIRTIYKNHVLQTIGE